MIDYIEPCREECAFCFLNFTDILVHNPLFRGLDRRELGAVIRNTHHQVRELDKNEVFAFAGDRLHHLAFVVEGAVVGEMLDMEGNIVRVEKMVTSRAIATAFLFGKSGTYPVTVTATEPTKLLLVEKQDLLELFTSNRNILKNFLDLISDRAQFLSQRIRMLSLRGLKAKVALYLLEIMKESGDVAFRIPQTQNEMAEMFGTTRPSVGRIFRELHNEGFIEAKGKQIRILDQSGLSSLISG